MYEFQYGLVESMSVLVDQDGNYKIPRLELCKHDDVTCVDCRFYEQCFLRAEEHRAME